MNTLRARVLTSVALGALTITSSPAVFAELPQLTPTQQVEPTAAEVAADTDHSIMFGFSVAVDGNTAMAFMPDYGPGGRIAIYNRGLSGHWNRTGTLDPPANEGFGAALVLKDDTALIGGTAGVYVYKLKPSGWTRTDTIATPTGRPVSFGGPDAVRYDNGIVAVGAVYSDDFTGAVFLYRLSATGHVSGSTQLVASDAQPVHEFGSALDLQGDTLVARGSTDTETVLFVFHRIGNQWTQTQEVTRPISDPSGTFGSSLALNRGVLLVGDSFARFESSSDTSDGHSAAGVVHVFTSTNGVFSYRTELRPTPDQLFN